MMKPSGWKANSNLKKLKISNPYEVQTNGDRQLVELPEKLGR
jgi:hypothetical protein